MNLVVHSKPKSLLRFIEYDSPPTRLKLEVGNPAEPLPWNTPPLSLHGCFVPSTALPHSLIDRCNITVIFYRAASGRKTQQTAISMRVEGWAAASTQAAAE